MEENMRKPIVILAAALSLAAAPIALAACPECGTVTSVKTVKKEGEASGGGAVLGGVVGGVIGHQIEKNKKSTNEHQVVVKLENGSTRTFRYADATSYKVGDKIKVVDDKLVRR